MIRMLAVAALGWATWAGVSTWAAEPAATPEPAGADFAVSSYRPEWEIMFDEQTSALEYARQLDYFKIEIGAVAKDGRIEYISNVTARKPDKRYGELSADPRWRIGWKAGTLSAVDRRLLTRAGVNSKDKELWHFFPEDIFRRMVTLERAFAKRDPAEIRRTRFQIRAKTKDDGYELVVVEQDPPPPTAPAGPKSSNKAAAGSEQGAGGSQSSR